MGWGTTHSEHLLDTGSQFFKINETRRKSALIPYLENLHPLDVLLVQRAVSPP